MDEMIRLKAES